MQQASLVEYGSKRVIITITAIICALLEIVDTTIVNVALNDMKGNLGATTSEIAPTTTAATRGTPITTRHLLNGTLAISSKLVSGSVPLARPSCSVMAGTERTGSGLCPFT